MVDPVYETQKRVELAEKEAERFRSEASGIILAGSVAYAPDNQVTDESDVDMIMTFDDIKRVTPIIFESEGEISALQNRVFEGYCVKREVNGVPISLHVLSDDVFDIISKCFVANMRVYRQDPKEGSYFLRGFSGQPYDYHIKNIPLEDLPGVRTIVPISFINEDRYFLGIHRDKLLSNPVVLHERGTFVSDGIDKLWSVVTENLHDEPVRLQGGLDLDRMSIVRSLAKREKMNQDVLEAIARKTDEYLERFR